MRGKELSEVQLYQVPAKLVPDEVLMRGKELSEVQLYQAYLKSSTEERL